MDIQTKIGQQMLAKSYHKELLEQKKKEIEQLSKQEEEIDDRPRNRQWGYTTNYEDYMNNKKYSS